jgi:hypothetical protein
MRRAWLLADTRPVAAFQLQNPKVLIEEISASFSCLLAIDRLERSLAVRGR